MPKGVLSSAPNINYFNVKRRTRDPGRRKFIKTGLIASVSVATGIGLSELAKRLLEPKMSTEEFIKNFDQIFSLLPMFEGTEIPYASYTRTKAYEFKSSKVYTLWRKDSERSLRISDRTVQLRWDGTSDKENYLRIYQVSSVKILKTYEGPNDGSPDIAELLNGKEITLISFELLDAFSEWMKTAPRKSPDFVPKAPTGRLV